MKKQTSLKEVTAEAIRTSRVPTADLEQLDDIPAEASLSPTDVVMPVKMDLKTFERVADMGRPKSQVLHLPAQESAYDSEPERLDLLPDHLRSEEGKVVASQFRGELTEVTKDLVATRKISTAVVLDRTLELKGNVFVTCRYLISNSHVSDI